ncbi:MAG: serine/threonine-protein kinase [Gemmatimonas sp.]
MPDRYLGRVLGKYRVTRLLGAGAFAWVYEAVDLDLEIPVALKVLRPEYAGQPAAEARFRREATTAARLRHPNIVFIRDVGEAEGTVFVAMDLLPLSLARRLEVFPRLPESEVVRFALDVAAALSIAHADGVVHRDIKPDNVMLGGNGEAIVADFGLAGAFAKDHGKSEADDHTGKVMGTPHYFSPEQARGLDLDGRSDLYSLGVMCYRAATGTLPFEGDDWTSVAQQHVEDTPVPPRMLVPELTDGFEAIVLRLLAKKPEQRFTTATQLADALLTLPTAPASHAMGLTPSSASVTQVAFPYLHSAVGKRSWTRHALLAAAVIAVTAAGVLVANPTLAGLQPGSFFGEEAPKTMPVKLDSTPLGKTDSLLPHDSVVKPPFPNAKPLVKPPAAARTITSPALVRVTFTAPENARLAVNDVPGGYGSYTHDYLSGRSLKFSAYIEGAIKGCRSAYHDTTVVFTASEKVADIDLDVGRCSVLLLEVRNSNNAEYTIEGLNFFYQKNDKYPGKPVPIALRNGEYQLTARGEKCGNYTDKKLIIGRDSLTGSDTVKKLAMLPC